MSQQIADILKAQKADLINKFLADVAALDAGIASFSTAYAAPLSGAYLEVTPSSPSAPESFTPEEQALQPGETLHTSTFTQGFQEDEGEYIDVPQAPALPTPTESIAQQPGEVHDEQTGELRPAEPWDVPAAPPAAKPGGRRTHEQMAADNGITLDIVKQYVGEKKITKALIEEAAVAYKAYLDETSAAAPEPAAAPPAPEQPAQAPQQPVAQPAPQAPAQQFVEPQFGPPATVPQQPVAAPAPPQFQQPVAVQPQAPAAPMAPGFTEGFGSANGLPY